MLTYIINFLILYGVDWDRLIQGFIRSRLSKIELADPLASKSDLIEEDAVEIGDKIKEGIARRHGLLSWPFLGGSPLSWRSTLPCSAGLLVGLSRKVRISYRCEGRSFQSLYI